jgi:adenylate cyclase
MRPSIPPPLDRSPIREALREEVNRAVERGAQIALGLTALVGAVAGLFALVSGDRLWRLGAVFAWIAAAYALVLWRAGRARRVQGASRYAFALPLALLPSAYFLVAEALYRDGAAAFINGPVSYVYLFFVVITGFLFSFRVSAAAGLLAAVGYFACYLIALPGLERIETSNALLHQSLTSPVVAGFKAFVFAGTGTAVGAIGRMTQRLLLRTLAEERDKSRLQRLFGQYVTGVVSDHLLRQAAAGAGQRVEVVILFSDLRGFSTFAEGRDPADVVRRLNAYLQRMVSAIQAEGGVVDKFIGDAVMAVFGGLVALDHPCSNAVRASHAMRARLAELNREWADAGLEGFQNGIGLHVGEVIQGPIGSHDRKEFTAIGDTVNTAARLEDLTKTMPSRILMSEAVYARLGEAERAPFVPLGDIRVKGKSEPVAVYGLDPSADR